MLRRPEYRPQIAWTNRCWRDRYVSPSCSPRNTLRAGMQSWTRPSMCHPIHPDVMYINPTARCHPEFPNWSPASKSLEITGSPVRGPSPRFLRSLSIVGAPVGGTLGREPVEPIPHPSTVSRRRRTFRRMSGSATRQKNEPAGFSPRNDTRGANRYNLTP